jgi:predicted RNase H-like HicB family nuclease
MKTLEQYLTLPYTAIVTPDEDMSGEPCYRAEHPQLPGCMSHGKTPEEAIQNLEDAKRLYIETRLELGAEIPEPAGYTVTTSSSFQSYIFAPQTEFVIQITLPTSFDVRAQKIAA